MISCKSAQALYQKGQLSGLEHQVDSLLLDFVNRLRWAICHRATSINMILDNDPILLMAFEKKLKDLGYKTKIVKTTYDAMLYVKGWS